MIGEKHMELSEKRAQQGTKKYGAKELSENEKGEFETVFGYMVKFLVSQIK